MRMRYAACSENWLRLIPEPRQRQQQDRCQRHSAGNAQRGLANQFQMHLWIVEYSAAGADTQNRVQPTRFLHAGR